MGDSLFERSIFYTGHRPRELGKKTYLTHQEGFSLYMNACIQLTLGVMDVTPVSRLVLGGALGWDKIAFYAGVELRKQFPNLKLLLVVPFEHQPMAWVSAELNRYHDLRKPAREFLESNLLPGDYGYEIVQEYYDMVDLADEVVYVDRLSGYKMYAVEEGLYHPAKLLIRNKYLVDQALIGISLFRTEKTTGGTYDCIKKAVKLDRPMAVMHPQTFKVVKFGDWARVVT